MFCVHCGSKIERVEGKPYLQCYGCGRKYDLEYNELELEE